MDSISSFAKTFSSEGSLAHAGTRRLSRRVLLGCGRVFASCPAEVIVCASSAAMALTFDAGGDQRQENYWVEDLTEQEAQELLTLRRQTDWQQFVAACSLAALFALFCHEGPCAALVECLSGGYNALDLVRTCEKYRGPGTLAAKKAEMKERAWEEVQVFKEQCKVDGQTGEQILRSLLNNRDGSNG